MKIQQRSKILPSFMHNLNVKNVMKPLVVEKVQFHEF